MESSLISLGDILKIVAILVTGITSIVAYRFWRHQLKINTRNTLQAMLIDIDKKLIDYPELWTVYDAYKVPSANISTPEDCKALDQRLRAHIFMVFNLFEVVFAYYRNPDPISLFGFRRLASVDSDSKGSWNRYATEFFRNSSFARDLWSKPATQEIYAKEFRKEINDIVDAIKNGRC